ncbi:hypothetical protein ACLBKU_13895 [Erythrobacter sp. NE805]|uniref:hypothetical protein n=1 Tax=Erythrobacter sp. NE805 TaxID=3389875 RepID=UPI00396AFCF4
MKIEFQNSRTQQLFNDHGRLEAHYGSDVADKIASRMALLSVAPNLAKLPVRPPIRFRPEDRSLGLFSLDVGAQHRLRFRGVGEKAQRGKRALALEAIKEIQVIGIKDV